MLEARPARPDELAEAGRVTEAAYREFVRPGETDWEEYLAEVADAEARASIGTVFVAIDDGRIVGSATLELDGRIDENDPPLDVGEAHIRMLGVAPEARGRGAARALMDACIAAAAARGRTRMTLHTTLRMRGAKTMYEAMGFTRLPDRVLEDGFVLLTYERRIGPG